MQAAFFFLVSSFAVAASATCSQTNALERADCIFHLNNISYVQARALLSDETTSARAHFEAHFSAVGDVLRTSDNLVISETPERFWLASAELDGAIIQSNHGLVRCWTGTNALLFAPLLIHIGICILSVFVFLSFFFFLPAFPLRPAL